MGLGFEIRTERWQRDPPLRIAGRTLNVSDVVTVQLTDGRYTGRGEAVPFARFGDSVDSVLRQLEEVRRTVEAGVTGAQVQEILGAGPARNALDCALWDLRSKQNQTSVWRLANIEPRTILSSITISLNEPQVMADMARSYGTWRYLKVKLGGQCDEECLAEVRRAAPRATLLVDANEGWGVDDLRRMIPALVRADVKLIEQPLRATEDDLLPTVACPIPLCADESCLDEHSLPSVLGKYTFINIKLDKAGGLTQALRLAALARSSGLRTMVGCMGGTSLAMAPAMVVAALADYADLDGPPLLKEDRPQGVSYAADGTMSLPTSDLWG